MRILKILLILTLALVTAAFGVTEFLERTSGKNEGPSLSCSQELLEVSVNDGDDVLLTGVTAFDPQDGDLTGQILVGGVSKLITDDTARVTYLVFDRDDNMASCTRYIRYTDYHRPRIQVKEPLIYTNTNRISILDRVSAEDAVDSPEVIGEFLRASSLWRTEDPSVYSVTVQVTNSLGDTARVELPVILRQNAAAPSIRLREQLVYLEQGAAFDPKSYLTSVNAPGKSYSLSDVTVDNQVNVTQAGNYWVWYTCGEGVAILTVVVE